MSTEDIFRTVGKVDRAGAEGTDAPQSWVGVLNPLV